MAFFQLHLQNTLFYIWVNQLSSGRFPLRILHLFRCCFPRKVCGNHQAPAMASCFSSIAIASGLPTRSRANPGNGPNHGNCAGDHSSYFLQPKGAGAVGADDARRENRADDPAKYFGDKYDRDTKRRSVGFGQSRGIGPEFSYWLFYKWGSRAGRPMGALLSDSAAHCPA